MGEPQAVSAEDLRDRRTARRQEVARAVEAFQRGERREESFALIYESYFAALQRFFRFKGISPEECLDLTQETFVGIYQGLEGYEHRDRFEGWLYRVAETVFLKKLRAAATAKRSAVEVSKDSHDLPEKLISTPESQLGSILQEERSKALREAVRELPGQMRRCVTLRLYHELSYAEIAVVMKLKIDTVKAHLARAKQRLTKKRAERET